MSPRSRSLRSRHTQADAVAAWVHVGGVAARLPEVRELYAVAAGFAVSAAIRLLGILAMVTVVGRRPALSGLTANSRQS